MSAVSLSFIIILVRVFETIIYKRGRGREVGYYCGEAIE